MTLQRLDDINSKLNILRWVRLVLPFVSMWFGLLFVLFFWWLGNGNLHHNTNLGFVGALISILAFVFGCMFSLDSTSPLGLTIKKLEQEQKDLTKPVVR